MSGIIVGIIFTLGVFHLSRVWNTPKSVKEPISKSPYSDINLMDTKIKECA
ncbi:MAG: hypothetical protein N2645_12410 [Clostridia bacterium]|nr:hypothetical protein [Clostridia bacterium]